MADQKFKILVFPCGSEIGLEIHRSLKYSRHVELYGASSVDDHGRFVYKNYIGNIPYADSPSFEEEVEQLVEKFQIDAIFPTMDSVISRISRLSHGIGCRFIGSPDHANQLALSKRNTYRFFENKIRTPKVYSSLQEIDQYPVFSKPDVGYGSQGAKLLKTQKDAEKRLEKEPEILILEYLPGEEYTVDCFSDRNGNLLFSKPRKRGRIQKGISVNTYPAPEIQKETSAIAYVINKEVRIRGAWFFQVKLSKNGELALLEFATRLGGSSALYRSRGVNFALMSVFDAFDLPVTVLENDYSLEMDRALDQKFKVKIEYQTVYVDLDDCLILGNRVNPTLIAFLFQSLNNNKKLVLITRHAKDLTETLKAYRLNDLFDEQVHLSKQESKADYIVDKMAIFIDDSFAERKAVAEKAGIPVFAPDSVSALITDY